MDTEQLDHLIERCKDEFYIPTESAREGGETSDRQWRDILSILRVQRSRIDQENLTKVAGEVALSELLAKARQEVSRH